MPPLGTKIIDQEALDLITKWIQEDLSNRNGEKITHTANSGDSFAH